MEAALDMGNNTLFNLKDPTVADQGANKRFVDSEDAKRDAEILKLNTTAQLKGDKTDVDANNAKMTSAINNLKTKKVDKFDFGVEVVKLTQEYKDYVNKSHITSSFHLKGEFRYLMEDVDESSSMHDITVTGINDLQKSPHLFNKKALIWKNASNLYSGRLGLNMYQLPEGEHTICIEFWPVTMNNVSVDVVSTSLNITQQSTKQFYNYTRSIVHMHKWHISPPEFIYLNLKCQGTPETRNYGYANLIIYGVKDFSARC